MNALRRIVANLQAADAAQSEQFFTEVLGLEKAMDLGWIQTYSAPHQPTVQVSVLVNDPSGIHPDLSVEVADVETVYAAAMTHSAAIVYPLTDEPWGVRRFFVRAPNGTVINIVSHGAS